jgi:GR25 family glycosyltransferase involved in LPS biosynthesis
MISHLEMWKKCVELNETVVILEHDSIVVSDTWKTPFDQLLHLDKHRFVEPDPDLNREPNVEKLEHYRKGQQQLQGTYGYVLKPQTAKRLIRGAYEEGLTAADMFVKDLYCNIQVVTPRAVKVNNQESLTSNRDFYI